MPSKPRRTRVGDRTRNYQRWTAGIAFVIVAELAAASWIDGQSGQQLLTQTGLPVSTILGGAAVLGILVSLVVFRTPHDGNQEF